MSHKMLPGKIAQNVAPCIISLTVASLVFTDDVILMTSSGCDLQCLLRRFEAAGMRVSTSKSEAMVFRQKMVDCPLRVGSEMLPQDGTFVQVQGRVQVPRGLVHE